MGSWKNVDPLTADRQFCDAGTRYRSASFVHVDEQRRLAEVSRRELEESGHFERPIVTEIVEAGDFWPTEDHHQGYFREEPDPLQALPSCPRSGRTVG